MMQQSISRYISALLLINIFCFTAVARDKEEVVPKAPLFCGVAVQADLAGPVMKAVGSRFDQMEVGARLNFRDHYFPLCELGIGECEREGRENSNRFKTRAPYFRIGMDYNLNKKHNGNRLMAGLRYAFSSFRYDFTDPNFVDPVWPSASPGLSLKGQNGRMQWLEASIGCETKLWSFIRLGWSLRYKIRLHQTTSGYGEPYYTPGFGKNGSGTFGGTVNLIFDVGKTSKKQNGIKVSDIIEQL